MVKRLNGIKSYLTCMSSSVCVCSGQTEAGQSTAKAAHGAGILCWMLCGLCISGYIMLVQGNAQARCVTLLGTHSSTQLVISGYKILQSTSLSTYV